MSIIANHVHKRIGKPETKILTDVSLEIRDGEFVALTGRSGSGKSTLLYILSSLDSPTEGSVSISGRELSSLDSDQISLFRNRQMGFVFQFHYLIDELSVLDNVLMPALKFGEVETRKTRALQLLDRVGLRDKIDRMPSQLSGGEQQRVAIARALVMDPKYLFADEPTGSLDTANAELVMSILQESNRSGMTVLMVTHDPDFANLAGRRIHLVDGRMSELAKPSVPHE